MSPSSRSKHAPPRQWTENGALALVALIVAGSVLQHGYYLHDGIRVAAFVGCAVLGCWAVFACLTARRGRRGYEALGWTIAGMVGVLAWTRLQLLPLPRPVIELLSPYWAEALGALRALGLEVPSLVPLALAPVGGGHGWSQLFASTLFLAAVGLLARGRRNSYWLILIVVVFTVFESLLGLARYALGGAGRAQAVVYNPNHHAAVVLMGLPMVVAHAIHLRRMNSEEIRRRPVGGDPLIFLLGVVALTIGGWLVSFSRGSVLLGAPFVALWAIHEALLVVRRSRLRRRLQSLELWAGAGVLLGVVVLGSVGQRYWDGFSVGATHAAGRAELWRATLEGLWGTHGLGLGLSGAEFAITRHLSVPRTADPIWSHNDWVQFVCEVGIPGVVLLIPALVLAFRHARRDWLGRLEDYDDEGLVFQRAALAGIASVLAHSLVDFPLRVPVGGFLFLILVAIMLSEGPTRLASMSSAIVEDE